MQTPVKLTLDGFYGRRAEFLRERTIKNEANGRVICRVCGTRIKILPAQIEIHEAGNGQCVGNGESFEAGVPYCPGCEELPAAEGCVHA